MSRNHMFSAFSHQITHRWYEPHPREDNVSRRVFVLNMVQMTLNCIVGSDWHLRDAHPGGGAGEQREDDCDLTHQETPPPPWDAGFLSNLAPVQGVWSAFLLRAHLFSPALFLTFFPCCNCRVNGHPALSIPFFLRGKWWLITDCGFSSLLHLC